MNATDERGQVCRVCGCTDDDPCDGGCVWAEDDLCSVCADPSHAIAGRVNLLLARAATEDVVARLAIGNWLMSDKRVRVPEVARRVHCTSRALYHCTAVAKAFKPQDVAAWMNLRDRAGKSLSWSHLIVLSTVRPRKDVDKMIVQWAHAREPMTVRELAARARARKGKGGAA